MLRVAESIFNRLGLWRLPHAAVFAILWLTVLILTALVSSVTYRLIERPGVRLGDLLIGTLEASARRKMIDSPPADVVAN
jgi:peptidoglycan/LPS O-acetylase OafA/YrhL